MVETLNPPLIGINSRHVNRNSKAAVENLLLSASVFFGFDNEEIEYFVQGKSYQIMAK
jgi:hypothetical protein